MIRHFAAAAMFLALAMPAVADGPAVDDEIAAIEAQAGELKKCLTPAQIEAMNKEMLVDLIDEVAEAVETPTTTPEPQTAEITPPAPEVPEEAPADYC